MASRRSHRACRAVALRDTHIASSPAARMGCTAGPRRMARSRARRSLTILLLTILAAAGVSVPPAEGRIIGRTAEISVGRETASAVEKFFPVDTDPVAVARVRRIGRRLAASAHDTEFPFEFHVIESGEVNAFALPGGFIYVFRGLLQLVPNDDALAFVMAHEVSHVTRRHAIRQFEKSLVLSAGITAILAGTGASSGFGQAADVVAAIASLSFTRGDEKDADSYGVELLARAGYNPRAAADAMRLVKRATGDDGRGPALFRSHPAPDSRIRKLTEMATEILADRSRASAAPKGLPPSPPPPARRISGLEEARLAPCAWIPLVSGARWTYRVTNSTGESRLAVRVLELLDAEPRGIFRVEYDLGRGVRTIRLLAPAGDRYLSRAEGRDAEHDWIPEAVFLSAARLARADGSLRCAAVEPVQTPAGRFEASRVERLDSNGAIVSTAWYARDVGLVKRVSAAGTIEELTSYNIPARKD